MRIASTIYRVAALVLGMVAALGCLAQTFLQTANPRGGNTPIATLDRQVYAYAPSLMADGAVYKIWFCSAGTSPSGDHIFYSESNNLDSGWSTPVSVFGGTGTADVGGTPDNSDFDRIHTCDPSVIRVDGTYYMYYGGNWAAGGFPAGDPGNGRTAIGVASSPDGKVWTRMNGGKPIITPKNAVDGLYGAGQPSVFYHRGLFYMIFTDTTTEYPNPNPVFLNKAFVLRSPDPTFQVGTQELTNYGTWGPPLGTPPVPARTWTAFPGYASVDWRYDDALAAVGVAVDGPDPSATAIYYWDIDFSANAYQVNVPDNWTEGPGLVRRPDGHAPPSAPGTPNWVPVDIVVSVGTRDWPGTYRLAHTGLDYFTSKKNPTVSVSSSSANMAPAGIPVTFTANVPGDATGTVTFYDRGGTALGTSTVSNGAASISTSSLSVGDHSVSASYGGDGAYNSASSPSIWQAIVQTGRIVNMSTRALVQPGTNGQGVLIDGFIIGGSSPKTVAITATGPSLAPYGIANYLPNPMITLVRSSDGSVVNSNDNWQSDPNQAQLQASGFAPPNPWEAGMLVTLAPGAYTAIVQGVGSPNGISLLGVNEVAQPQSPFVNLSARAMVGTGVNVAIMGFIIQDQPRTVAITATGPSLAPYQISPFLANPKLTLIRSSDQAVLATNDDWMNGPNASRILALGLAPANPFESAIITTLAAGAYTVIMEGVNGGTGIGLAAVYGLPQGY